MEDLVFIDVEASGLHHDSYPIEVGWAYLDLTCASFLIRPAPDWGLEGWSLQSEKIHGISRDLLLRCGVDTWEAARRLNSALAGRTVLSDAPAFDTCWLRVLFDSTGIEPAFDLQFTDALVRIMLHHPGIDLDELQRRVATRWPRNHRAAADAVYLAALWRAATEPGFLEERGL